MRKTFVLLFFVAVLLPACVATRIPQQSDELTGMASWYGEEFAGRTTANGEIFDPMKLTAAHQTLPFGTILDVTYLSNGRKVTVRINDRGPFVGNRILDLSYGAAREIGLVEPGIGQVQARIVAIGRGEREPPRPYVVKITPPDEIISAPERAPSVAFPLPGGSSADSGAVVDNVVVIEERAGEPVRRQVGADGVTIQTVTEDGRIVETRTPPAAPPRSSQPVPEETPVPSRFVVQLGAFQVEANADVLRVRVAAIEPRVYLQLRGELHRVRVGPFPTREAADEAASRLAAAGYPGIVLPDS
ncbi:MAG TPA: septal ring lytic transglycosylase RlpA family protein [Thermoanaerobaculia bacterium]|nr:septal ring lytic transglycosylase RlpA family protein [Thermoanaerobaculia bacterium]